MPVEATNHEIIAELKIPTINLVSDVAKVKLEDHQLKTPDYLVGSFSRAENKTLLIGHSSEVFKDLFEVKSNDAIYYNGGTYYVTETNVFRKDEINMNEILSGTKKDTLILMTCAGKIFADGDATHRLVITAEAE